VDVLLRVGLGNALQATILAVAAAGVTKACRRPALAHTLWLLVLLKFLTPSLLPVLPAWPVGWEPAPAEADPAATQGPQPLTADSAALRPAATQAGFEPRLESTGQPTVTPLPELPGSTRQQDGTGWRTFSWHWAVAVGWLTGSLVWWSLAGWRIGRFRRLLGGAVPGPTVVQDQVRRLAERLGLSCCPGVWFVAAPVSPMLWALGGKPGLLLPAALWDRLSREQQDTLLGHELAHLRRGDHWVRRLELVVLGLYWWHPVAWWARRRLQEAEEQCCDAWVVWALPAAAVAYAEALLQTVAFLSAGRPALPATASGIGQAALLRRRLTMILRRGLSNNVSRRGRLAVLGLGAMLLPLLPTWAEGEGEAPPSKPVPVEAQAPPGDAPPVMEKAVGEPANPHPRKAARDHRPMEKVGTEEGKRSRPDKPVIPEPRFVNNRFVGINFDIRNVGPSGISALEVWSTRDGHTWQKVKEVSDPHPPVVVSAPGEGRYGFTLVARSGAGLGARRPKAGDAPQLWVEVDLTPPTVRLLDAKVGRGKEGPKLTVTWTAEDKNFGAKPITLSVAEQPGGPWMPIADHIENTGRYEWAVSPKAPLRFYVRVEGADRAGNVASVHTPQPVVVDPQEPEVRILGVEPVRQAPPYFPHELPPDVMPVRQRSFVIPVRTDPAVRAKLKELILYVSTDQGLTWQESARISPDKDKDSFTFQAPADGLYWFNVSVVDGDGRHQPLDASKAPPAIKVWVRTGK
jgi:beta-lactamase regulating signal transducer with metallopeptidase domain